VLLIFNANAGEKMALPHDDGKQKENSKPTGPIDLSLYFDPVIPGDTRPASRLRPLKIDAIDTDVSVKDFKEMLQNDPLRMVFHCDGAPLPAERSYELRIADGWKKTGLQYTFGEERFSRRRVQAGSTIHQLGLKEPTSDETLTGTYTVTALGKGLFEVKLAGLSAVTMRLVKVEGTTRRAIELLEVGGISRKCKSDVETKALWVPVQSS
jgi:hypothetical protein